LLNSFFGAGVVKAADIATWRSRLIHEGFDEVIKGLINDPRFADKHGPTGIPRYTERAATGLQP
jgi:hypothetical protein